jgi:hypothetical protein
MPLRAAGCKAVWLKCVWYRISSLANMFNKFCPAGRSTRLFCAAATLCGLLLFESGTVAADRYVDATASGKKDGSSWENAWSDTTAVNWNLLQPGDTLWISGGVSGLTYSGFNLNGKGGEGDDHVTIRCSQAPGRNGMVTIKGGISFMGRTNIIMNGARNDNFVIPTSVTDMWQITNNIGIRIDSSGNGIVVSRAENSKIMWLDIRAGTPNVNRSHGIWLNCYSSAVENMEIAYNYIHDCTADGINIGGSGVDDNPWGNVVVHHNVIFRNVDDGIQIGGNGLTAHHNIIGHRNLESTGGHPDSIQPSGGRYMHIYNNVLYNSWNAWFYSEIRASGEWSEVGDIYFYGNLCYTERDWVGLSAQNYGFFSQGWRDPNPRTSYSETFPYNFGDPNKWYQGPATNIVMTNVYIVNNTFYNQRSETVLLSQSRQTLNINGQPWFTGVHNQHITNAILANNILLDCGWASKGVSPLRVRGRDNTVHNIEPNEGSHYTETSCVLDHNIVAGWKTSINYNAVTYQTGEDMAMATSLKNNRSAMPLIESTNTYDFRLKAEDTVARNKGMNLSPFTNRLVGLSRDLWGNPRGQNGGWDIGAHEFAPQATDTNFVVWLKFEDSFQLGMAHDYSGNGNHGLLFGYCGQTNNWPRPIPLTKAAALSVGADFTYYHDNYGQYGRSGDYIGITNLNAGNVEEMTMMLWAKYDAAHNSSGGAASWTTDHNATLIDNGRYLTAGGWRLGRENFWAGALYNNRTKWTVFSGGNATNRLQLTFNDAGDRYGATAQMNHYAVVFDRGTNWLYLNGVLVTNAVHSQKTLQLNTQSHWLGIGAWPHHGSVSRDPWLISQDCPTRDEYPNAFWFKGKMDDIRIYTRALGASEIQAIYEKEGNDVVENLKPSPPTNLRREE